jgi:diaminopimelate epimerase
MDDDGWVNLKMQDVNGKVNIIVTGDAVLNTGSPHYIKGVNEVKRLNVYKEGQDIRYSNELRKEGINVNFVEQLKMTTFLLALTKEVWKMKRTAVVQE